MPLIDKPSDLSLLRELALKLALEDGRPYLVIPHCDPREQWAWKKGYVVAEEDASTFEQANHAGRLLP